MSSFNIMTPWFTSSLFPNPKILSQTDSKYSSKRAWGKRGYTQLSINFHTFPENERIGLTWPS